MTDLNVVIDVYKWVIEDVTVKLQPEFENAGVPLQFLHLIKQSWTERMQLNMREQQNPTFVNALTPATSSQSSYSLQFRNAGNSGNTIVDRTSNKTLNADDIKVPGLSVAEDPLKYTFSKNSTVDVQNYAGVPQFNVGNMIPKIMQETTESVTSVTTTSSTAIVGRDQVDDESSSSLSESSFDPTTWTNEGFCLFISFRKMKNKRRFFLKNGILYLNGRDYLFKSGEACMSSEFGEFSKTPLTKVLQTGFGVVKYEDTGEPCDISMLVRTRPIVLCIPELGDSRFQYRLLVPWLFETKYRVICVDLCNSCSGKWKGTNIRSAAQDVSDIVKASNLALDRRIILIGHGESTFLTLTIATLMLHSLEGLVLINPKIDKFGTSLFSVQMPMSRESFWYRLKPKSIALKLKHARYLESPKDINLYMQSLKEDWNKANRFSSWSKLSREQYSMTSKQQYSKIIEKITCPVLSVSGELENEKFDVISEYLKSLELLFSNALFYESKVIYRCGLSPQEENPVQLFSVIDGFATKCYQKKVKSDVY